MELGAVFLPVQGVISITLNTYSHVAPELSRSAADRIQQLFSDDSN